ncbi:hypothetical protein [Cetobacterium somerae]|uniref:hypothetical protein n=1 Tax=Cetobacterium somerae TaxID=188913 RepID=UPI003891C598
MYQLLKAGTESVVKRNELLEIVDAKKQVIVAKGIEVNLSGNPKDRTPEIEKIIDNKLKKMYMLAMNYHGTRDSGNIIIIFFTLGDKYV